MAAGEEEELPESPSYNADSSYNQSGFQEELQYGETSASGSNSGERVALCESLIGPNAALPGEDDDERDYDGKRPGAPMNGLASKKRRKQSKPIRLGNDSIGGLEGGAPVEQVEGEEEGPEHYRRQSGDSLECGTPPSQGDAPLNLSAPPKLGGEDKSEQGGLRVLGRELLMQHPEKQQEGNRISGGSHLFPDMPFGMPPSFMFPGMAPNASSPGLNMSRAEMEQGFTPLRTGDRPQIFNIEAYCKLCNKEFCNKYFLKTHMANKHGVYSDPPPTTSSNGGSLRFEGGSFPSSMTIGPPPPSIYDKSARFQYTSPPMSVSLPTTPVSFSGSFTTSMRPSWPCSDSPRMAPLPPSLLPQQPLPPQQSPNRGSDGSQSRPQSNTGLRSPLPSPTMRPQSQGPTDRATPNSMSPKSGPPPLISGRPFAEAGEGEEREEREEGGERPSEMVMPKLDNLPPGIRLPMVPSLNPFGPLPFFNMNPMSPMDVLRKEDDGKGREMLSIPGMPGSRLTIPSSSGKSHKAGSSNGPKKDGMTPDRLRQMGVINADAFCEYCCKEFCNKYFLRVHKLKKHGVCSPELPPEKVQKILAQMAKEAGKTGQPMPPLTLGSPSVSRPPGSSDSPRPQGALGGALSAPLNLIRPPLLPNFLNLPPLDPIPLQTRDDERSSSSSDKGPDDREEGRPANLHFLPLPTHMMEPECELKIDESAPVIKSPLPEGPREQSESSEDHEQKSLDGNRVTTDHQSKPEDASEGLANLQNMIMKLNNSKPRAAESTTVCKICNKDMDNKYFLHAHMMNEHGVLHVENDEMPRRSPNPPVTLPQFPADLSKSAFPALTIPSPLLSRPPPLTSMANGFPKLSDKPLDFPKSLFEQMQGLPRPSFLDQMKKDLGGAIDIPMSPLKRPTERDPNKKPASLSRSYCEICKKELCNKYFMKTHMMKMHGIMMEQGPPNGGVSCDICKKELSSRYFLKVHMANGHGLNEDGSPIPPHLRENGLLNMFPIGEFPPPPMGEFSRLLMQQGEKNMERLKELDRQKSQETNGQSHVCSLCSNSFPDIIALQVHIIKNHGALPPTTGVDILFNKGKELAKDGDANNDEDEKNSKDGDDYADKDREDSHKPITPFPPPPFPFPLDLGKMMAPGKEAPGGPLSDLLHRQALTGLINPMAGLPGLPGLPTGAANPQFHGLFNMFLSEMLKKVAKETPPQTPPASPPPPPAEETSQDEEPVQQHQEEEEEDEEEGEEAMLEEPAAQEDIPSIQEPTPMQQEEVTS
jgi:hypothetical protein